VGWLAWSHPGGVKTLLSNYQKRELKTELRHMTQFNLTPLALVLFSIYQPVPAQSQRLFAI
jgi:hypothetical protein